MTWRTDAWRKAARYWVAFGWRIVQQLLTLNRLLDWPNHLCSGIGSSSIVLCDWPADWSDVSRDIRTRGEPETFVHSQVGSASAVHWIESYRPSPVLPIFTADSVIHQPYSCWLRRSATAR